MGPIHEQSAGVIPFFCDPDSAQRSYLLVHSARAHNPRARWEFPRGAIGPGETPRQAAARGFAEETGLSRWQLRDGFSRRITYTYTRNRIKRVKTVTYFLAQVLDASDIRRSIQHVEDSSGSWFHWSRLEEAEQLLAYDGMRAVLRAADSWLQSPPGIQPGPLSGPRRPRPRGKTDL